MKHCLILCFLVAAFMAPFARCEEDPREAIKKTIEAAGKTMQRLQTEPFHYRLMFSKGEEPGVSLDVYKKDGQWLKMMSAYTPNGEVPLIRLVEQNNLWYAYEPNGIKGIYRPWEAPFHFSVAYQFLTRTDLQFLTEDAARELGDDLTVNDTTIVFQVPLPPEQIQKLKHQLENIDRMLAKMPAEEGKKSEQLRERIIRTMSTKLTQEYFRSTGIAKSFGPLQNRITVESVVFNAGDADFVPHTTKDWVDHSSPPTTEDLANSIMIAHSAWSRPDQEVNFQPDIRLLNLKTGALRRAPVQALESMGSAFSPDRSKVYVSAAISGVGPTLLEVDLISGEQRVIAPTLAPRTMLLGAAVTKDGRTAAVADIGHGEFGLSSQIYLIDLKTNEFRQLGTPQDVAFHQWLPGDKGLVMIQRSSVGDNGKQNASVVRVDLDGKSEKICDGRKVLLLADGKTMLVEDENRAWRVVDFQGKIVRQLTDGSQWHMLSSLDPEGKRVLGVKNARKGRGAEPIFFDPITGDETPLTLQPGLWTHPIGR